MSMQGGRGIWEGGGCCAVLRLGRRRRRWPLPRGHRRPRATATSSAETSALATVMATGGPRFPRRWEVARSPPRHPRGGAAARPRRRHRCRRRRATADDDTNRALGGGEAVTRSAACGGGNDGVVVGRVGWRSCERVESLHVWQGDVGQLGAVTWRGGAAGGAAGGTCFGAASTALTPEQPQPQRRRRRL